MTNAPIFNQDDVRTINRIVTDDYEYPNGYPSSRALVLAIESFTPVSDAPVEYLKVGLSADPFYIKNRITNIDIRVRKDHVDAFVRHLATNTDIHTIKVNRRVVYVKPVTRCGFYEDVLAGLTT